MKQDIPYLEYTTGLLYAYMLAGLKQHQRKADRILVLIILVGVLVCLLSAVGILPTGSVDPAVAGYHRAMAGL